MINEHEMDIYCDGATQLTELSMRDKVHLIEDEMKALAQTPEFLELELPTRH